MSTTIILIIVILLLIAGCVYVYLSRMHTIQIRREKVTALKELYRQFQVAYQQYVNANTLASCYEVYKNLIKYFFPYLIKTNSLRADPYGIFRAPGDPYSTTYQDSLKQITKDNIFLGDINGLWTKPLSYWETCNDKESQNIVWGQFHRYLFSGLKDIEKQIKLETNKVAGHQVYRSI